MKAILISAILLFIAAIVLLFNSIKFGLFIGIIALILLFYGYINFKSETQFIKEVLQSAKNKEFGKKYTPVAKSDFSEIGILINEVIDEFEKTIEIRRTREKEFLTILDAITSPVVIVDEEGNLVTNNISARSIFRKLPETEKARYYYEAIFSDELNKIIFDTINEKAVKVAKFDINSSKYEVNIFPFVSRQERFFLFYLDDITEKERMKEMQRSFISSITHEIRTPLSVMIGSTEILAKEKLKKEERNKLTSLIKDSAERMNNLVTKLAELNALQEYGKPLNETVDLKEICQVVHSKYKKMAEMKNIDFVYEAESIFVLGDSFLLEELLSNLVENAINYTAQGSVKILVLGINEKAKIIVKDTGEGIKEEFLSRVFEPFETHEISRSKKYSGLGLGLSIVKRITELHKGEVSIRSTPFKGTEVEVILPIVKKN